MKNLRLLFSFTLVITYAAPLYATEKSESKEINLFTAVEHGDIGLVRRILNERPEAIEQKDPIGSTPLGVAIMSHRPDIAHELLKRNASTTGVAQHTAEETLNAMHCAAEYGVAELIDPLAEYDPELIESKTTANNFTPLQIATFLSRPKCVKMLLRLGADTTVRAELGDTLLHLAALHGNADIAGQLLAANTELLDLRNNNYLTALHWAAAKGDLEIARLLVEHGANANAQDSAGLTPFSVAAKQGYKDVADFLADPHKKVDTAAADDDFVDIAKPTGNKKKGGFFSYLGL